MASPPQTPTRTTRPSYHTRTASNKSLTSPLSHRRGSSSVTAAAATPYSPRVSRNFDMQNNSPAARSKRDSYGEYGTEAGGGGGGGGGGMLAGGNGGLGNLADELGDSWDEDDLQGGEDEDEEVDHSDYEEEGNDSTLVGEQDVSRDGAVSAQHMNNLSSPLSVNEKNGLSPGFGSGRQHRRQGSIYDGSEYGDDSDFEDEGITPGLERQMAAIESLARRGIEANGSENDGVVNRVTDRLKDLGSQSGVEGGASRLTTAHTALSTHITHQTRHLLSYNSSLFSPLAPPLHPDLIDPILPLISTTLTSIPTPQFSTLNSLISLSNSTADLLDTLSLLSDTMHMSRQASLSAQRRLRSVKEQLAEWNREQERAEEGRRYIERGEWDKKIKAREAGRVCGDVVGGFEAACEGWRRKLVDTLEAC